MKLGGVNLALGNLANLADVANLSNLGAAHKNRRHAAKPANLWAANPRILGRKNGENSESLAPRESKCPRAAQESRCESTPPHGESSKSRKTRNAPRRESAAISAKIRAPKKSTESFEGFAHQILKMPTRHALSALPATPPTRRIKANPNAAIFASHPANLFCESHAQIANLAANPPRRVANPSNLANLWAGIFAWAARIRRRAKSGESCESFAPTPRIFLRIQTANPPHRFTPQTRPARESAQAKAPNPSPKTPANPTPLKANPKC